MNDLSQVKTAEREPEVGLWAYTTDGRTMIIDNDYS